MEIKTGNRYKAKCSILINLGNEEWIGLGEIFEVVGIDSNTWNDETIVTFAYPEELKTAEEYNTWCNVFHKYKEEFELCFEVVENDI